jgi:neutral ceramidase
MQRVVITTILLACSWISAPAAAQGLGAGVAVSDITPPTSYRMSGYFSERLSTGTHDPLKAKAIVFEQGETQAALVFCDLIGLAPDVTQRARKLAEEKTGIPAANILVAATHSHTGPLYSGALRKHFHDKAVAEHGKDAYEEFDYPSFLVAMISQAVQRAQGKMRAAVLEAGMAEQRGLSFNRRFHMKDGTVRFNPGKLNPNIVRVAGPIDPDVGILLVRQADGRRPLASLTVFALHLDTVGGTEYSADYPYYLGRSLHEELGPQLVSVFGTGTCGDINHVDVSHDRPQKGQQEAERIGAALGETVRAALGELRPLSKPSLAVRRTVVDVPLQRYSAAEVAQAKLDMEKVGTRALPFLEQVNAYKILALQLREGSTLPMEVQVFRLSDDVAIVGLPGEVFVELGLAIKKSSPFATTMVVELCNDAPGYVPTRKAFAEGSYETVNSRVQSGGGEMLVEAAVRLLNELK